MITITHTHAEGTLVDGTSRGDGTREIFRTHRVRWGRSIGCWYLPHSRDRLPQERRINALAEALRAAGFEVAIELDHSLRPAAEVEADRAQRATDRAQALAAKADRHAQKAADADAAADRALEALPPGGEPIKIGHHSEGRHRRAVDRAHTTLGRAVAASQKAQHTAGRAAVAEQATARRYNPVTVANRIETLEAEQRADQRQLDGHTRTLSTLNDGTKLTEDTTAATGHYRERVEQRMAERADQITYWQQIRAEQQAAGIATNYGPDTIAKGDLIQPSGFGSWCAVVRVNKKSVSVTGPYGYGGTVRYHEIRNHQPATDATEAPAAGGADEEA